MSRFKDYKLTFTDPHGQTAVIDVQPYGDSDPDDGTKGHLYSFDGLFTLGDLAALVGLLQRREAPGISGQDWARLRGNIDENRSMADGDTTMDES